MKQPQTQKKLRQSILSFLTLISLQEMVSALEVGDKVSAKAVGKAEFIQGSAPEKWEKGKVYVLECWSVGRRGARRVSRQSHMWMGFTTSIVTRVWS